MDTTKVEFRIRFDGNTPGLQNHRLSLASFGDALQYLMKAFRRAADQESKNDPRKEGLRRFGKYGQGIDLQLAKIEDGCTILCFECVFPETPEINHVAERAVSRVLHSIEIEANGNQLASPSVRKFLETLPLGINSQEYEGLVNGTTIKKITLREMKSIEERRSAPPRLITVIGRIVGVSFTPQHETVKIKTTTKESITCLAETSLIDKALSKRHESVIAQLLVRHDVKFLLAIYADTEIVDNLSAEERLQHIINKWDSLLRRLA